MYSFGETKKIVNGQVVQDSSVKSEYNGQILHVDKVDNNKFMHYTLNDKDLKKMLKKKTSKLGLLERLDKKYMKKKKQHTRKRKSKKQTKKRF
jgi:hypothetical protein